MIWETFNRSHIHVSFKQVTADSNILKLVESFVSESFGYESAQILTMT